MWPANNPGHIDGRCRAQFGLQTVLSRDKSNSFNAFFMLEDGITSLDSLASQTQLFIGLITKDTAHYLMLGILPQPDCTLSEVQVII